VLAGGPDVCDAERATMLGSEENVRKADGRLRARPIDVAIDVVAKRQAL
jgi:hypothetical protein